jgi:phosphoribosylaminoimidazole carboxylase (NCAIR synthetase)
MGSAFTTQVSANAAEDIVNDSVNVVVQNVQNCRNSLNKQQLLKVTGNKNENIDINNIDFNQAATINTTCIQNNTDTNKVSDAIQDKFNQKANNLNKSFLFGSGQFSFNYTKGETNLTENIAETFKNKCVSNINNSQSVIVSRNTNGQTLLYSIDFNQTENEVLDCVQQDQSTQNIKRDVQRQFNQQAGNRAVSPLISIVFYIVIGLAIVGGIIIVILLSGAFSGGGSSSSTADEDSEASTLISGQGQAQTKSSSASKAESTSAETELAEEAAV